MVAAPASPPAPALPSPAAPARLGLRLWLRLALSLLITAAIVILLGRRIDAVPDDLRVPLWLVPAYLATLLLYFLARAGRWWFLVRPLGPVAPGTLLAIACAGFLWILLLPWRLGEFVRPLLLARASPIPFSQALGTVALERVVDGLIVCGMFFAATATLPAAPAIVSLYTACLGVAALFGAALLVLLALAVWPRAAGDLVHRSLGRLAPGLAARLAELARGIAEGLAALPSARPLLLFVLVTLAYWAANALGMWMLARGCGVPLGLAETFAVLAVLNLTLLIPGPPAHVGTFQLGLLTGLALFLPPATVAGPGAVFAFYLYVCQLALIVALGVLASLRLRWGWRETLAHVRGLPPAPPSPP
ncbi:MAG: flippase-like domain-containing protein [Myxococcales bacterium]|nr:flippase-like domain-containing protein [Myxococcales bacterium]